MKREKDVKGAELSVLRICFAIDAQQRVQIIFLRIILHYTYFGGKFKKKKGSGAVNANTQKNSGVILYVVCNFGTN